MKFPVKLVDNKTAIRTQDNRILSIRGEFKIYLNAPNYAGDAYEVRLNTSVFNPETIFNGTKDECEAVIEKLAKQLVSKPLDIRRIKE